MKWSREDGCRSIGTALRFDASYQDGGEGFVAVGTIAVQPSRDGFGLCFRFLPALRYVSIPRSASFK